jgi:hypothetical protein
MGARLKDVEVWFVRRGVPHFIDDYAATTDIWTRSTPLLIVAYFAGGLHALDLANYTFRENVLATCVVLGVLVGAWAATNLARRRPFFAKPMVVGTPELVAFVLGPAVPSAIFAQWGDMLQTLIEGLVVLAAIYLVTSYAVFALLGWALRRSVSQLRALGGLVVRALPLLLLFTTFLFINAEVWQVAGTLTGPAYIATLSIFFVLGAVFVLSRMPALMRGLSTFPQWSDVHELVADTPATALHFPDGGVPPQYGLSRRQKLNVGLVTVFSQALQVTFVALVLTLFFSIFGLLAIPEATTMAWTGLDEVNVLVTWHLGGREIVMTESLLRVAGFLGAFTGMYFTVVLSTDATYRDEFAEDVGPQIRQALAVRVAYLWHRTTIDDVAATPRPEPLEVAG